jgi:retinol-binding protein 3
MKRILLSAFLGAALFWPAPFASPSQAPLSRPVTIAEKRQALAELARLLRTRYAIAATGEAAAALMEKNGAAGAYDALADALAFGDAVTRDLREATKDKHLAFGIPAEKAPAPGAKSADAEAERAYQAAEMKRGNFGFPRAEILPGNVGLLEVLRFQPPDQAGDTIAAAVAFLAQTDAVLIDLRNCHGGNAYVMPIFTGYFLPRPTSLYDMVFRGDGFTERFWSAPWLPGKKLADVPLYILTSAYTFSGAEALAYRFQVLKRAIIVGETTAGGANAGGIVDVGPIFKVWLPMGRPVDADTGTNWEGTGVVPDVRSAAREAPTVAHIAALRNLRAKAASERDRTRLDAALERAEAGQRPVALSATDLGRLAGTFGPCRIWVEGGQLRIQRGIEAPFLLVPLTARIFISETIQPVRLEFFNDANGAVAKIAFLDEAGMSVDYPKDRNDRK